VDFLRNHQFSFLSVAYIQESFVPPGLRSTRPHLSLVICFYHFRNPNSFSARRLVCCLPPSVPWFSLSSLVRSLSSGFDYPPSPSFPRFLSQKRFYLCISVKICVLFNLTRNLYSPFCPLPSVVRHLSFRGFPACISFDVGRWMFNVGPSSSLNALSL
jgi:hypothetical protein